MKTHTIYRKPNSNDFGSQCVTTDGVMGLVEVTMQQHKNRCCLFVGDDIAFGEVLNKLGII